MLINIVSIGKRMPSWCQQAFKDYASRLSQGWQLKLIEIPSIKRSSQFASPIYIAKETALLIKNLPSPAINIALTERGRGLSSAELADDLKSLSSETRSINLLIGGADGLGLTALNLCRWQWSLSKHTLPHYLVRVIVAEQVYRAYSILHNHPYHRGQDAD